MPEYNLIHIVIHIFAIALGLAACMLAWLSHRTSPAKVVRELVQYLDEVDGRLDRLDGKWKKLNANYALILARTKSNGQDAASEPDDDDDLDTKMKPGEDLITYKQRMRRLMSRGKLRHAGE